MEKHEMMDKIIQYQMREITTPEVAKFLDEYTELVRCRILIPYIVNPKLKTIYSSPGINIYESNEDDGIYFYFVSMEGARDTVKDASFGRMLAKAGIKRAAALNICIYVYGNENELKVFDSFSS